MFFFGDCNAVEQTPSRPTRYGAFAIALLVVALCAALSGCGSGSGAVAGPTPTPTPVPAPTPTPTPAATPNPTPSVGAISPTSAPAGALAFTLTVNGSSFVPGSTVQWDGSSRTTTFVSSTQLQAQIMAADLATPGKTSVTVVNPAPGGGSSGSVSFTVAPDTIVFESQRALDGSDAADTGQAANIWIMNPDGSGAKGLTNITINLAGNFGPVWSPDGSKIAFASKRAVDGSDALNTNDNSNVWLINADGSGLTALTKLTNAGVAGGAGGAAWSPDGSKIVFASTGALDGSDAANTALDIWVMNADGSGATPLTKLTASGSASFSPAWSPDGSKIAFISTRALDGSDAAIASGTNNIWIMNADGSGATPLTKLTAFGADNRRPVWSPDSRKIAFDSGGYLDGSDKANPILNIWSVNADGSSLTPLTQLTATGADSEFPAWSPDGKKIAFTSSRAFNGFDYAGPTFNIWVMNADGFSPTPVTKLTNVTNDFAVWSPGGTQLFFSSARALDGSDAFNSPNGTTNVWLVNADGSGATALTKLTALAANSDSPRQP